MNIQPPPPARDLPSTITAALPFARYAAMLTALALLLPLAARAQYQMPLNGGTLSWTANSSILTCGPGANPYTQWQFGSL